MIATAFKGDKVVGAILFERTMDGDVRGVPTPTYLWKERGVVPKMPELQVMSHSVAMGKSFTIVPDCAHRITPIRCVIVCSSLATLDVIFHVLAEQRADGRLTTMRRTYVGGNRRVDRYAVAVHLLLLSHS
jgi:hypothetical protein